MVNSKVSIFWTFILGNLNGSLYVEPTCFQYPRQERTPPNSTAGAHADINWFVRAPYVPAPVALYIKSIVRVCEKQNWRTSFMRRSHYSTSIYTILAYGVSVESWRNKEFMYTETLEGQTVSWISNRAPHNIWSVYGTEIRTGFWLVVVMSHVLYMINSKVLFCQPR
jgi:hypothetical protein